MLSLSRTALLAVPLAARHPRRLIAVAVAVAVTSALSGCASTAIDANFASVRQSTRQGLGNAVAWLSTDEARSQADREVDALLARPITADDAVRIALGYSPALQALLFEGAARSAAATQAARLPNPVFALERLVRQEGGVRELELTRSLSMSLLDLLLWPARQRQGDHAQAVARLTMSAEVVQAATEARRAWVHAVAAQQSLRYVQQVKAAADASAELARRMLAAGNYSRLQRAREQAFSADAAAQLARATESTRSSREALVRALGLDAAHATQLQLPDRLPDLPLELTPEASLAKAAIDQRLDLQLARANLAFIAREQGLTRVTSVVDGLQLGIVRQRDTGQPTQRGYELSLPLPLFDWGDASRARAQASYMAALHRTAQLAVDASSQWRDSYGAYRTAYDIARHYRDEVVPLRKAIADENLLRYNGMLISVFELLADAREQIGSVVLAIDAQRDFWLADAALQATLLGKPMPSTDRISGEVVNVQ